jgi:hypothetical protein
MRWGKESTLVAEKEQIAKAEYKIEEDQKPKKAADCSVGHFPNEKTDGASRSYCRSRF